MQSKEKMMKGVRRGCVRLKGAVIGIDDQDVNTFTITVDHKTFHFQVNFDKIFLQIIFFKKFFFLILFTKIRPEMLMNVKNGYVD